MNDPFFLIIIIAVAAVLIILMLGLGSFAKGGSFSLKNSNKMMRLRLVAQFIAVLLIAGYVWLRG